MRAFKQKPEVILKYPDGKRYYREFHNIRKRYIDHDAEKVLNRLNQFGHRAYLVGGCIRDILLNRRPKDFDIVTSAHPSEVRRIFKNSRTIGRRFKINHIVFGRNKIIEVSTARSLPLNRIVAKDDDELYLKKDNYYGNFREDAARRDFTINSLYFDFRNETIIDYTGGVEDIQKKVIQIIGDENISLPEDPVRILRALKFASLFDFQITLELLKAIRKYRKFITKASIARLHEEFNKIFWTGKAYKVFAKLVEMNLFQVLFPSVSKHMSVNDSSWHEHFSKTLLGKRLIIADKMIGEHEDINNNLYYSILLADCILDSETLKKASLEGRTKYEKATFEKLMKMGKEFGLTRREGERLTKIFTTQQDFLKDTVNDQNQNRVKRFKEQEHFTESFILYKINVRAKEDNASIQKALFWEIGFRKKLPDAIHTLVNRPLQTNSLYTHSSSHNSKYKQNNRNRKRYSDKPHKFRKPTRKS